MEFKGSKGLWYSVHSNTGTHVFHENKRDICSMSDEHNVSEAEANALLISKAPDMLKMLQFIYGYGEISDWTKLRADIEKLIQEATEIQ